MHDRIVHVLNDGDGRDKIDTRVGDTADVIAADELERQVLAVEQNLAAGQRPA